MNRLITSVLLTLAAAIASFAYPHTYYAATSALADGRWVKLSADTTGIYEVSHEQLRKWGFSNPEKVSVYGYGGIRPTDHTFSDDYPDDLPQTASMHTSDGRLLFYAEADTRGVINRDGSLSFPRNYYDTRGYYFLTDSRSAKPISTISYVDNSKVTDWHYNINLIEREKQNPAQGGALFHGDVLQPGQSETFDFVIPSFAEGRASVSSGTFRYEAAVKTATPVRLPVTASDNLYVLASTPSSSGITTSPSRLYVAANGTLTFAPTAEKPLNNTPVTFTVTLPEDFQGTYAAIDRAYVMYPRVNDMEGLSQLHLNFKRTSTASNFSVVNASEDLEVWNVTDPTAIARFELSYNSKQRTAVGSFPYSSTTASSRFISFEPSRRQLQPRFEGTVVNQNIHAAQAPDMIIVCTEANKESAARLAAIHTSLQGLDVLTVTQDEVFNEFGSGAAHPSAVRRMAKMFYDREGSPLRFLLLYGPATWDPRSLLADHSQSLICFQTDVLEKARETGAAYCADQYFGMLADGFDPANIGYTPTQIAVGRVPVANNGDGDRSNAKTRAYLSNPPSARTYLQAVAASDNGDSEQHLLQSREGVDILVKNNPAMTVTNAAIILYPIVNAKARECAELLRRTLSSGTGLMTYCGHSGIQSLTGEELYNITLAQKYNYERWPLAMLASCDAFPLDRYANSLAEAMLFKQNGGASGVIAACRAVYLEHNKDIHNAVAHVYSTSIDGTTTGEVFARARNRVIANASTVSGSALCDNTLCYNLCGDPALPIGAPTYRIDIESVKPVKGASLSGLSTCEVKAKVVNSDGHMVTNFSGTALIDIYDAPAKRRFVMEKDSTIVCDEVLLSTLPVKVSGGRIDTRIVLPNPMHDTPYNRLVLTATDADTRLTAAGASCEYAIKPVTTTDNSGIDSSAPVVEQIYIDSPDFTDGDATAPSFTLHAVIDPSASGLARNTWWVSAASTLTLDGVTSYPHAISAISIGEDGKAHLSERIDNLSDGRHTFTLNLINNAGESSSRSLDFVVVGNVTGTTLTTDTDGGPARNSVTFGLDGNGTARRLFITDEKGATVLSKANCTMPWKWNLKDTSGKRVPDGRYHAVVLLETESAYGTTDTAEVIVLSPQ